MPKTNARPDSDAVVGQVELFDGVVARSDSPEMDGDDYAFLRRITPPRAPVETGEAIRAVDLFSGIGGITVGLREACRQLGRAFEVALAMDFDDMALQCFVDNFNPSLAVGDPIESVLALPGRVGFSESEVELKDSTGSVDLLVGGPPCQGHSDFNNSTRRNDPKNVLYLYMVRAAELFEPEHVLIENVVGALNDRSRVVQTARRELESLGYRTSLGVVDLHAIGVPQTRRRVILLASKTKSIPVDRLEARYATEPRDLRWGIGDLVDVAVDSIFDESSNPSDDNLDRIAYLFENDLYDLPNDQRPPCHRSGGHSYKSIYGRLRWDDPAQTITRGFYSTCMGRYVHPERHRTLTAHEAARLQFFPDFFDFGAVSNRTSLARVIGNAVPPKLGFVAGLEMLD